MLMDESNSERQYHLLFPDDKSKAAAFDKIAHFYYFQNFATMSKAEIDLLMFSEYVDRLLALQDVTDSDYSEYTLSKQFGITQARIRALLERKELKYPSDFNWKKAFRGILDKAEYKNGKIYIYIRDGRLYTELSNAIKELGSYPEATLTRQLLVVSPPVFVDLMVESSEYQVDEDNMREQLQAILYENNVDMDQFVAKKITFREALKDSKQELIENIIIEAMRKIPVFGDAADIFIQAVKKSNLGNPQVLKSSKNP